MKHACVLVIDDSQAIAEMVKHTFMMWSKKDRYIYELSFGYDGVEGLQLVRKVNPDLILLDIDMPRLNGYEVLRILRSRGNRTPVIIMTGRPQQDIFPECLRTCDAYVSKPFDFALLYDHVQSQLKKKDTGYGVKQ